MSIHPFISDIAQALCLSFLLSLILWNLFTFALRGFIPNLIDTLATTSGITAFFSLSPKRGLLKQGPFFIFLTAPFFLFLATGRYAWAGKSPSYTAEGFAEFLTISILPLGILASTIPLLILISRLHGTEQTAAQINETLDKNNRDAFWAHHKAFIDYFSQAGKHYLNDEEFIEFSASPRLYRNHFIVKGPKHGQPEIQTRRFAVAEKRLQECREQIRAILLNEPGDRQKDYEKCCVELLKLLSMLIAQVYRYENIKKISYRFYNSKEDRIIETVGHNSAHLVTTYRFARANYRILCEFADYPMTALDKQLANDPELQLVEFGDLYLKKIKNIDLAANIVSELKRSVDWRIERRPLTDSTLGKIWELE